MTFGYKLIHGAMERGRVRCKLGFAPLTPAYSVRATRASLFAGWGEHR